MNIFSQPRLVPCGGSCQGWPSWQLQGCQGLVRRGEYFSKIEYICTYPKNGPARESSLPWFLDSNISARTPKKAIFLHIVVIFLHGTPKKAFFYAQLNKKLAKSALYHIMHCFAFFPWFKGPFELPFSIKYTVGPLRSGIPNLVRIRTKVPKMVRNRSGIGQ